MFYKDGYLPYEVAAHFCKLSSYGRPNEEPYYDLGVYKCSISLIEYVLE